MRLYLPKSCLNKRICVALSGGGDSVALLFALKERAEAQGIILSAVNVEHGIRGESSLADTKFVKNLCARENIPLFCYSEKVPRLAEDRGVGLEEAARAARYRAFLDVLRRDKADYIATAHHAGDNAESVLFNLFRGSALTGACGIRRYLPASELARGLLGDPAAKNGSENAAASTKERAAAIEMSDKGILRPLLGVTKAEILAFLRERGLNWREDESNADASYTRNFLRGEVLAPARSRFPALDRALYNFSRAAREDDEFLYALARGYLHEGEVCYVSEEAPKPLFVRACLLALRYLGAEKDYSQQNLLAVLDLTEGENGASADLPHGIVARREYGKIAFYRRKPTATPPEYPFGEGEYAFGEFFVRVVRGNGAAAQAAERFPRFGGALFGMETSGHCRPLRIDGARLPVNCVLRTRKEGDVFQKFGSGTKKLKDYFIDAKIPRRVRDSLPLVACGKEVFAVCGAEISEKVKIGDNADVYTILLFEKGEFQCTKT